MKSVLTEQILGTAIEQKLYIKFSDRPQLHIAIFLITLRVCLLERY